MSEEDKNILLVDDDQMLLDMYKERLTAAGFNVVCASNGSEALEKANKGKFNLILLDIMMPKINGLDVLKKLKASEKTKKIPVFLLTALIQDEDKMKGVTAGADGYLIKSEMMPGDVIKKINDLLLSRL